MVGVGSKAVSPRTRISVSEATTDHGVELPAQRNNTREIEEEIDALSRKYGLALKHYFQKRINDKSEAEDLVQEVFFRLVRYGNLQSVENIEGFLFHIATNLIRDLRRKRISHNADLHEPLDDNLIEESAFSPERVLLGKESVARIKAALLELPQKSRVVFVLCQFEGLTHQEAAEYLRMPNSTLRRHLKKAMDHVYARLEEKEPE
jgi:RNA polymerase sigma factor (sigma-70 family)